MVKAIDLINGQKESLLLHYLKRVTKHESTFVKYASIRMDKEGISN